MPQVQLDDRIFKTAQQRAAEGGYPSVDAFVADVISNLSPAEEPGKTSTFDHLFTPERIALIEKAEADIKAGRYYTAEQAEVEFTKRRAEWLRKNHR